jgi:hypothetical protein
MRLVARRNGRNTEIGKESFVLNVGILNTIGNLTRKIMSVSVANFVRVYEAIQLCTVANYLFGIGL